MMRIIILMMLSLLFSTHAIAHTGLQSSFPSHKATFIKSPENITLRFNAEVRLIKLSLENSQGKKSDLAFKASKKAASTFQQVIPVSLSKDTYAIKWIAISGDGHKVKGSIRFVVTNDTSPKKIAPTILR